MTTEAMQPRRPKALKTLSYGDKVYKHRGILAKPHTVLLDEKRNILRLCISRIVASDYDRSGNMRVVIEWRDGSTEEIRLWPKSKNNFWSYLDNVKLGKKG